VRGPPRHPALAAAEGVLVVDKPVGPTSFDVVARVKRLFGAEKAGHTGTLDPRASGVLPVCVGDAVKLQQFLTEGDKRYRATIHLGAATTTQDAEGEVIARGDPSRLDAGTLRAALARFVGEIQQIPPMYSAVRVDGRRLHQVARAGGEVERPPRTVHVAALELMELSTQADALLATVDVRCGKGTYVRTLAADLGEAVGVPAHLAALRRLSAGPFVLEEAIPLDEVERMAGSDPEGLARRLVPLADALRDRPAVHLSEAGARDLGHGRPVSGEGMPAGGLCRALGPDGRLLAVCQERAGQLRPVRVLRPVR
jgi:tRNA pseudouridine55 synthase